MELAETYLSVGAYRYAAFCYEELVLLNPMDAIFHSRLADVRHSLTLAGSSGAPSLTD